MPAVCKENSQGQEFAHIWCLGPGRSELIKPYVPYERTITCIYYNRQKVLNTTESTKS